MDDNCYVGLAINHAMSKYLFTVSADKLVAICEASWKNDLAPIFGVLY